jgi:hypothetical protein
LICRVESEGGRPVDGEGWRLELTRYVREVKRGWDEVINEGYGFA